jgi:hypothetical protein
MSAQKFNPSADPEKSFAQRRIKICKECKYYKMFVCGQCGCFMPVKVSFKNSTCPLNKWAQEP